MFVRLWQFRTRPEGVAGFRAAYGPDGEWARLFARSAGYIATELLQSTADPDNFVTLDRWDSIESWAAFLRAWGDEYAALDRRCRHLTLAESEIGAFQV